MEFTSSLTSPIHIGMCEQIGAIGIQLTSEFLNLYVYGESRLLKIKLDHLVEIRIKRYVPEVKLTFASQGLIPDIALEQSKWLRLRLTNPTAFVDDIGALERLVKVRKFPNIFGNIYFKPKHIPTVRMALKPAAIQDKISQQDFLDHKDICEIASEFPSNSASRRPTTSTKASVRWIGVLDFMLN